MATDIPSGIPAELTVVDLERIWRVEADLPVQLADQR